MGKRQSMWFLGTMGCMFVCLGLFAWSLSYHAGFVPPAPAEVRAKFLPVLAEADAIEAHAGAADAEERENALQSKLSSMIPSSTSGHRAPDEKAAGEALEDYLSAIDGDIAAAEKGRPKSDSTRVNRAVAVAALRAPGPADDRQRMWAGAFPYLGAAGAMFFVLLMGGTVGRVVFEGLRNAHLRRVGVLTRAEVIHARSMGYVNWRPNYELEMRLPDGGVTRMQMSSSFGFTPGQVFEVLVDPKHPGRAVMPKDAGDGHTVF